MKRFACVLALLLAAILAAGCSHAPPPAATPAPAIPPTTSPAVPPGGQVTGAAAAPAVTATVTAPRRQIDVTAVQDGSDVVVRYRGGADAAGLLALVIKVDSFNGQSVTEREDSPVTGQLYTFPAMGTPDPDIVTVTGIFRDGTEEQLLQTKV